MGHADAYPPSWYRDAEPGWERWWDGHQWTAHRRRVPIAAPPPPAADSHGWHVDTTDTVLEWADGAEHATVAYPAGAETTWPDETPSTTLTRWVAVAVAVVAGIVALGGLSALVLRSGAGDDDRDGGSVVAAADTDPVAGTSPVEAPASSVQGLAASDQATTVVPATVAPTTVAAPTTASPTTTTAPASAAPTTTAAPTTAAPTTAAPTTAPATSPVPTTTAPPTTVAPTTAAPTTAAPTTVAPTTTVAADCHPAYQPCLPNLPGDALNCGDLSAGQKPVTVIDPSVDPYGLDADGDGRGCESG